jgi:hypothetical protein
MVVVNQSDSLNWSGHSQGTLDSGGPFSQVSADWVVPTAKQHATGQPEYSSTWIGIGGGCLDSNCSGTDGTLIQAGTEQDVDAEGRPSYSAWYELIPAPSLSITSLEVQPGDLIHVDISQLLPGAPVWTITIDNKTNGQSYSTTVPYVSAGGSAEWIVETPLILCCDTAGLSSMPDLTPVRFDHARKNGAPANLSTASGVRLVSGSDVVAAPSAPDAERDGFHNCTYASTCPAPGAV